jgi:predicted GNAT family acetyltransferase
MAIDVAEDTANQRYTATLDGELAGFVTYTRHGDVVTLVHTEVDKAYEGHGVGSALARGTLDDLRRRGLRVRPQCPFMAAFIERHGEYSDLVARHSA